jgi:HSP20 family protein
MVALRRAPWTQARPPTNSQFKEHVMTTALAKREPRSFRPLEPLQTIHDEFEVLWNRLVGEWRPAWLNQPIVPAVDLTETAGSFELRMDLPGFQADDVNVQISNNVLTVSGHHEEDRKEDTIAQHRTERRSGRFSRTLTLPAAVEEDKVEAKFRDGVLTVTLQKSEESACHKVKIQH